MRDLNLMLRFFLSVRQLFFPKEFRICFLDELSSVDSLVNKLNEVEKLLSNTIQEDDNEDYIKMIAGVGTGLWRLKKRMVKEGTDQPQEGMRKAYRHVESVWDVLLQAGVEIQDHTGIVFDPGFSIKIIAYQPMQGITKERVVETIKPSIYFKGRQIQMGEVIVGTPLTEEE